MKKKKWTNKEQLKFIMLQIFLMYIMITGLYVLMLSS